MIDDDGYIHFVGRGDDVFKSSDYRISPFELESVLVEHDATLMRPSDIAHSKGNPCKAIKVLDWKPSYGMRDVVRMMLRAELHSDREAGPI